jgi:hypothetical protein
MATGITLDIALTKALKRSDIYDLKPTIRDTNSPLAR